jgi:hypothetical protein
MMWIGSGIGSPWVWNQRRSISPMATVKVGIHIDSIGSATIIAERDLVIVVIVDGNNSSTFRAFKVSCHNELIPR